MRNEALPMNADDDARLITRVRIASPCSARWEDMQGDERMRFCGQCSKHVFNFSAMSAPEIAALVREKEGRLCGRFYRCRDGTMLTADCPSGLALRSARRARALAFAAATLVLGAMGGSVAASHLAPRRQESRERSRVALELDRMIWKMRMWLGIASPAFAGGICVVPPAPSPAVPAPPPPASKPVE